MQEDRAGKLVGCQRLTLGLQRDALIGGIDKAGAADADDSGVLDLADGIYSLEYQFLSGPPPVAPFPACGEDPSPGSLGCDGTSC